MLGDGVDVRALGGFIIAADGDDYVLLNDKRGFNPATLRLEIPELPNVLSKLLITKERVPPASPERECGSFKQEAPRILAALDHISARDRDDWLKVGMALHAFSGASPAGFGLWVRWSLTCREKFNAAEQRRTWEGFEDRQDGITLGWLFWKAQINGWVEKDVAGLGQVLLPVAKVTRTGELTAKAMASMRAAYMVRGLSPSDEQWAAIEDPIATMEAMANGQADAVVYLSALDPGVGKTQGIVHFVQALLASKAHTDVAVLICVGRLKEIATLAESMGLNEADYSVYVNDSSKEGKKLNALGNQRKADAPIMFTTQQMLESRGKRAKTFKDISEFHWKGSPRQVKIWDEAILPGRPLTVNVTLIDGMTHVIGKRFPKLLATINSLLAQIKRKRKGDFVDIPEFEHETGINAQTASEIFENAEKLADEIKRAADDLWLLSGKTVSVTKDAAGNTVLDYEETLLADLKPILVLDASGRIRQTYAQWSKSRRGLVQLRYAAKNYRNLTPHVWRRAGSKDAWRRDRDTLAGAVANEILREPRRKCLVVHPMINQNFKIDIPFEVNSHLTAEAKQMVSYLHWGDHSASNDYRDVDKVILTTVMFREPSYYESMARLSSGLKSDQPLSKEAHDSIRAGERADLVLQAVCRSAVRKPLGDGCYPCDLYIITHPKHGIEDMLPEIFPDCQEVRDWLPVARELRGRVKKAFKFIVGWFKTDPRGKLSFAKVRAHMNIRDRGTFHNEIINHQDFEGALAKEGIVIKRKLGKSGNHFVKRTSAADVWLWDSTICSTTPPFDLAAILERRQKT